MRKKSYGFVSAPTGFEDANSHVHPFQAFQWADYSAEPRRGRRVQKRNEHAGRRDSLSARVTDQET